MSPLRLILHLFLCLTLGLATTISTAWVFAAFVQPSAGVTEHLVSNEHWSLTSSTIRGSGSTQVLIRLTPMFGGCNFGRTIEEIRAEGDAARQDVPRFCRPTAHPWIDGPAPDLDEPSVLHDARGWPLPALRCFWTHLYLSQPELHDGRPLPPTSRGLAGVRAIPCRPIPLGLTADTLIFALAWSALLFTPRAIRATRRTLRLRRGLCPKCSYNLSGLPPDTPCPECGQTSRARSHGNMCKCEHVNT